MECSLFGWLVWDPDRNLFVIPYFNHPITWYGFLFALGFLLAYFLVKSIFESYLLHFKKVLRKQKNNARQLAVQLTDRLTLVLILGTVIGARLGHVFFYDWPYYSAHPFSIFKVWEGGLASHGAVIGILIALIFFALWAHKLVVQMNFLVSLDVVCIAAPLVGTFIRIGNFINQEVLGKPTEVLWAVIFKHPIDGVAGVPLHPVQLYEAIAYLVIFLVLFGFWKNKPAFLGTGFIAGLFFILVFGFRFFVEYLKLPQSSLMDESKFGNMGQLLSIPFFLLGIFLLFYGWKHKKKLSQEL